MGLPDKAVFKPDFHPRYQRQRMQEHLTDLLSALGEEGSNKRSADLSLAKSVHVACCGTGYEVEALRTAGYEVSASDLSGQALRGLAKRAATRGYQVPYLQADVLHLPFADNSFDLAVVVEGLHHTPDPVAGFAELVRIARRRVGIIEPYTGATFDMLARLGLAHRHEYSDIQPLRLTAALCQEMLSNDRLRRRARRLYLDLPPGPLIDRLGALPALGLLLTTIARTGDRLLRMTGVGNKVLMVADLT